MTGGVVSAEIVSVSYCAADRFSAALAIDSVNLALLTSLPEISIIIFVASGESIIPLIEGKVDCYRYDFTRRLLWLEGRDLTALFIEEQASQSFVNQTSSDIAILLAGRHGMNADVMPTKTLVGRYYEADHSRMMLDQFAQANTEWDMLVWLAHQENFDVWVSGNTLHFQPRGLIGSPTYVISPANCIELEFERAMSLAQNVQVTVKSWNSFNQSSLIQTASSGAASGGGKNYVVVRPNLNADQAGKIAQSLVADISQHERVLNATIVGEATLSARDVVQLVGTGTSFDQSYRIVSLVRRVDDGGFVEHITAMATSAA
jgi:phage protein D